MNTFLPTKRRTSSSKKTFSTSFLRLAYGSIFALLLFMSGGNAFGQETIACPAGTVVGTNMTFSTTNFTIVHSKGTDGSFASYTPWRVYTGNTVTFTGGAGVQRITSIVVTATSNAYASAAVGGTQTVLTGTGSISASALTTTATFTVSGSDVKSIRIKPNAQSRWSSITINYESSCSAPTVALSGTPVTSIATTTVTLNGNVTAAGGFAINTRGFEYSTNSGMTSSSTKSTAATATGTYSENVTGLVANTVYYYRGYAVNDCSPNKTGYTATSSYPSFTTLANAPTVGTGSGATPSSFTANWTAPTGGAASFTYEIQVDDDNTFASVDFTTSGLAVTSVSATGLSSATTYYYRVRAVNAGGNSAWSSVSAGIATLAPAPEINIKQGVTIIESAGTFAHGNQITTTSGSAVTFTIENTGEAALSVGALSKSGTDAGQFTITQPLSSSVAAGGTTTFTVVFSPTSLGAKTAQLSLVNGDADENPYIINLTGTGTASAASDIVTDATFTYATNIDYKNYITADITAANSVELGRFTIRDGGATTDADNLGTTLSTLGITVGNVANLQRLAIYDGSTEIAEVAASGTTNFTGLTLSAADNATKTFTIRGSFNTTVTDNQRITLTIASATASASGSTFGAISATTSATGTNNVLVVTADRLTFTTQPVTTTANTAMATVVVAATDINANKDEDKTGSVAITSTGTLTGSPVTVALSAGAASFTTLTHTVAATGRTLSATLTGLTSATSSTFDITEIVYVNGDYKSKTGGTWHSTTASSTSTWETYSTTIPHWNTSTAPPTNAASLGTKTVYIEHAISLVGTNTAPKVVVSDGGVLSTSTVGATFGNLLVKTGGIFNRESNSSGISGVFEVEDNATVTFKHTNSTSRSTSIWAGTEKFHANSYFEVLTVDSSAMEVVQSSSDVSQFTDPITGTTAAFGNIIINCSTGKMNFVNSGFNANLTHKNLIFRKNSDTQSFSAGNITTTIGGNLVVETGYNQNNLTLGSGGTVNVTIKGNINHSDDAILRVTTNLACNAILKVEGDISITGAGKLDLNSGSGSLSGSSLLELMGDLVVSTGSSVLATATGNNKFDFKGTYNDLISSTIQTIDIVPTSGANIKYNVKSEAYAQLINQNFGLGTANILTVESEGTFDFGFTGTTALNVTGTSFDAQSGSTIKITSPQGITTTGTAAGNVQTTTRNYSASTYEYKGLANQITGTALPISVSNLIVNNSGTAPTNEVSLTNNVAATTKLNILTGVLNLNEKTPSGGKLDIANAATLKIVGTDTFPTGFSSKTFATNSIVEYGGASQSISALTEPTYAKLKVSGTGTKTLATTDVQVGNTLEVTSSTLAIAQGETLTVTNGITTVDDAISVANGGSLVQVTDVNNASANNNTGKIGVARITQPMYKLDYSYWSAPVGGTTLHDLSPDTPANRYFYWNPVVVSPAANWTVISGGTGTMSAGKGYIIRAPSSYGADPTLLASYTAYSGSFSGVPNNGTVSVDVSGSDTVDVWNLVGNPYPSAIDASAFLDANVGGSNDILGGTLYFWTHNTPYGATTTYAYSTADYATWNGTGETATTSDTVLNNSNSPSGKIAAAQAFFVRGTANGTAVFKNTMREKGNNMQFFRGAATAETTTTVEKNRVWLNLKGANNAFSQTLVGYVTNATNDYDVRYDGESFGGNFVTFYSVNNGKNLVSQGRALPFVTTDEVPLGYKATGTGNLTISIDHTDGALATQAIYLKDNLLDVVHNLTTSDYTFAAVAGTFNDRFVLRYLPAVDLANPTFEEQISNVTIRKNDTTLRVNSPYETIDEVLIYDIMGRLLFDKKDCNTNTFETNTILNGEQTLIVKVRLTNGGVVTKKVL